jgi:hypothetical protein
MIAKKIGIKGCFPLIEPLSRNMKIKISRNQKCKIKNRKMPEGTPHIVVVLVGETLRAI